jgi:hypothetical protein
MSRLILKGNTLDNFGKRFPVPYIERIEISDPPAPELLIESIGATGLSIPGLPPATELTNLKVKLSFMFNDTDNFDSETVIEQLFNQMHLNLFVCTSRDISSNLIVGKKNIKQILGTAGTATLSANRMIIPGYSDSPSAWTTFGETTESINTVLLARQLADISDFGEYTINNYCYPLAEFINSITFDGDYDDNMNKIIKTSNIELDILIPNFKDYPHLQIFAATSTHDINDMAIMSNIVYGMNISDLSYESVVLNGTVAIINSNGYTEKQTGNYYTGHVMRSLNKKYYKAEDFTPTEVVENLKSVTEDYYKYRDTDRVIDEEISNIEYQISRYQDNIDFMERLNDYLKIYPDKTAASKAGQMYERIRRSITNSNTRIKEQIEVIKKLIRNVKIRDLRPLQFESSFVPSYDASLSVDDFLYKTILQTGMAKFQPTSKTKWKPETEYNSEEFSSMMYSGLMQLMEDYGFLGHFAMNSDSMVNIFNHANRFGNDKYDVTYSENRARMGAKMFTSSLFYFFFGSLETGGNISNYGSQGEDGFAGNLSDEEMQTAMDNTGTGGSQGNSADGETGHKWSPTYVDRDAGDISDTIRFEGGHAQGLSSDANESYDGKISCFRLDAENLIADGKTSHVFQRDNKNATNPIEGTVSQHNHTNAHPDSINCGPTARNGPEGTRYTALYRIKDNTDDEHSHGAYRRFHLMKNSGDVVANFEKAYLDDNFSSSEETGVNTGGTTPFGPFSPMLNGNSGTGHACLASDAGALRYQALILNPAAKKVLKDHLGIDNLNHATEDPTMMAPLSVVGGWFNFSNNFCEAMAPFFAGGRPSPEAMSELAVGNINGIRSNINDAARYYAQAAITAYFAEVKSRISRYYGTAPVYKLRTSYSSWRAAESDLVSRSDCSTQGSSWAGAKEMKCAKSTKGTANRASWSCHAFMPWQGYLSAHDTTYTVGGADAGFNPGTDNIPVPMGNPGSYSAYFYRYGKMPGAEQQQNLGDSGWGALVFGSTGYRLSYGLWDHHRECPGPAIGFGWNHMGVSLAGMFSAAAFGREVTMADQIASESRASRGNFTDAGDVFWSAPDEEFDNTETYGAFYRRGDFLNEYDTLAGDRYNISTEYASVGLTFGPHNSLNEVMESLMYTDTGFPQNTTCDGYCRGCPPEIMSDQFGNEILGYALDIAREGGAYEAFLNFYVDAISMLFLYHGWAENQATTDKLASIDVVVKKYGWYFFDMEKYIRKSSNLSTLVDMDKFIKYFPYANDILNYCIRIKDTEVSHFRTDAIRDGGTWVPGGGPVGLMDIKDEGYDMYMKLSLTEGFKPITNLFKSQALRSDGDELVGFDFGPSVDSYNGRPPWPAVTLLDAPSWDAIEVDFVEAGAGRDTAVYGSSQNIAYSYIALRNVDLAWVSGETSLNLGEVKDAGATDYTAGSTFTGYFSDDLEAGPIPNNYRIAAFNYNWYIDDDLTGLSHTEDHYNVAVEVEDFSYELVPGFVDNFKSVYDNFVENYYNLALENCTFDRFNSQFNEFFATNMNERYGDNLAHAPWFQAPAVWAIYRDMFTDAYNGDIELMFEDARRMADLINPNTGFLDAVVLFKEQMDVFADTLAVVDGVYGSVVAADKSLYSGGSASDWQHDGTGAVIAFAASATAWMEDAPDDWTTITSTENIAINKKYIQFNLSHPDEPVGYVNNLSEDIMPEDIDATDRTYYESTDTTDYDVYDDGSVLD